MCAHSFWSEAISISKKQGYNEKVFLSIMMEIEGAFEVEKRCKGRKMKYKNKHFPEKTWAFGKIEVFLQLLLREKQKRTYNN